MINKEIKNWKYGVINNLEPNSIPVGSLSDALNFLTKGDHIELRRGSKIIGADAGVGSISGLGVSTQLGASATQIIFRTRARKIEYYDSVSDTWIEIGTNTLPVGASGEDTEFAEYQSQSGAQTFFSSPLSSIYKIMTANPGYITDLVSTVYRGYIRIKQNRMFLWNRNGASGSGRRDEQNVYNSYVDARVYTTVTGEATTSLSGTLTFKAGGAKRTCFGIVLTLTVSGEVFSDNRDGTLSGTLGNTGTINYTTGDYTVSIAGIGTVDYQWEDTTNNGIADFSFSGTRTAGQGNFFLQGDGGPLMGIESYGDVEYCMHKLKTYALSIGTTDTSATNLLFRDREGIPNHRAIKATSLGIFYVNALDSGNPKIKLMTLQLGSTAVDGLIISASLNLSGYSFDRCFIEEWDDYIVIGCRTIDSTSNNRFILYNKLWKAFDVVDFWGLVAKVYNGALLVGESITGNVVTAFSGTDDDGAVVDGYAETNEWDLEYPGQLKKCKSLEVEGNIGPDQVFDVEVALDGGSFTVIGQIDGSGTYVDRGQSVDVGADTVGRHPVGGEASTQDSIIAYHYFHSIPLRLDKFERIQVRFTRGIRDEGLATQVDGIGYFSVSTLRYRDIRIKNNRIARKYR